MIVRYKKPNDETIYSCEVPTNPKEWRIARQSGAPALSLFFWTFGTGRCIDGIYYPQINRWSFNKLAAEVRRIGKDRAAAVIDDAIDAAFSSSTRNAFALLCYRLKCEAPSDGINAATT